MLSIANIREINRQIRNEMFTVSSMLSSDAEKSAALDRIDRLQAILNERPTLPPKLTADRRERPALIGSIFGFSR